MSTTLLTRPPVAELEFAARTHVGLRRAKNEDAVVFNGECGLAILADGMGGYQAGEVASTIATNVVQVLVEDGLARAPQGSAADNDQYVNKLFCSAIWRANLQIMDLAARDAQCEGMGTTIVACVFYGNRLTVAHVGDSRLYRLRRGELARMTRDHSLRQQHLDAGIPPEQSALLHQRNYLTRALGVTRELEIETASHRTAPGDIYLLCSDGISDLLDDAAIADLLRHYGPVPQAACDALIDNANAEGGFDNSSAILVKIDSLDDSKSGLLRRMLRAFS